MASNDETIVSPVTTRAPDLTASIAAVNAQPVELDSTPTSPEKVRRSSRAIALEQAETKLTPAEQEVRHALCEIFSELTDNLIALERISQDSQS